MKTIEIEEKVKNILSDILCLGVNEIANEDDIVADFGADFFDLVNIEVEIENLFDIDFNSDNKSINTVQDIIDCIGEQK